MSEQAPIGLSSSSIVVLLVLSAFFSATETALMSLNRYRCGTWTLRTSRRATRMALPPRSVHRPHLARQQLRQSGDRDDRTIHAMPSAARRRRRWTTILTFVVLIFARSRQNHRHAAPSRIALRRRPSTTTPQDHLPRRLTAQLFHHRVATIAQRPAGPDRIALIQRRELRTVRRRGPRHGPAPPRRMLLSVLDSTPSPSKTSWCRNKKSKAST